MNTTKARRSVLYVLLLLAVCLTRPSVSSAQVGTTSLGTDFWIGMMPNWTDPANNIRIFVASGTANTIHCDFFGGSPQPVDTRTQSVGANEVATFYVYATELAEERNPEKIEFKAIHVYAQNPIAVYAITNSGATTDSYLGLPIQALGTDYIASCYYDDHYNFGQPWLAGEFLIVAPYDDTRVTIHDVRAPTRTDFSGTLSHDRGDTWDISLQRGQTYLVQSTGLGFGDDDLTGTRVTSDKPIGFISGHQRAGVPIGATNDSKDHLCEMYPSVDRWGTEYYDMPMAGRTVCGDYIRLIAGEDNVQISENGRIIASLSKAGDFVDRELILTPVRYLAVKPDGTPSGKKFLTVQFSYTQGENGDPGQGDPFSIVMTPREQFQTRLLFRCPNNQSGGGSYLHYATFICEKDSISHIMINGKRITSYPSAGAADIPGTSNPTMSAYRIKALSGDKTYVATCGSPFAAYLYGFTTVESYGHPAGMALRVVSPDPIAPAEVRDSSCGTFHVKLKEVRHKKPDGPYDFEDTRINEVAMITDAGDLRWDKPAFNYGFAFDTLFTPGDSIASYTLTVQDLTQDAYAAVWAVDRAGNDTLYEYYYYAPQVSMTPVENPYAYQPVTVSVDSCKTFVFKNVGVGDLEVTDAMIQGVAMGGTFKLTPNTIHQVLKPNDSVMFTVCFTPSDTVVSDDTLIVQTGCVPYRYALEGIGVTPIILADNLDFGGVAVGDTACKTLKIKNIGNAPLVIDHNWVLKNQSRFFFRDDAGLPVTINPGETREFNFCYAPDAADADSGQMNWSSNLLPPYLHMKKDTSILSGYGLKPGLNWDRPSQGFTVECKDTVMQRVNLVNPTSGQSGTSMSITKVQIEGPDKDEFTITNNSKGYLPLETTAPWPLDTNEKVWIDITFKPDLSKGYRPRNAKIVAYGRDKADKEYTPEVALVATVRHSEIRITPASYDFGVVSSNSVVTTDLWLHNDGDTDLVIGTLTLDGGYTMSGVKIGDKIAPGDSVMVTVVGVVADGPMNGTLSANGTTDCSQLRLSPLTAFGSSTGVAGTGHDYGDVFVCKDGTATVTASNTGFAAQILASIRILDTLGTTGASQFTFDDGSQTKVLNQNLDAKQSADFTVRFTPVRGGAPNAYILYSWIDTTATPDTMKYVLRPLAGNPLFYQTTLSVYKDYGNHIYTANTGDVVSVPVQMKVAFDTKANVYGVEFTLRYRRDEFSYQGMQLASNLTLSGAPTTIPDPADNAFELLTAKATSSSPITALDTVSHVQLRYNIALDTVTPFQITSVAFYDQAGTSPCWVLADAISGTFEGADLCGNSTIRGVMGGNPIFSIRKVTPNPVHTTATVAYDVHINNAPVSIEVYDVLGNKVASAGETGTLAKGSYTAPIDVTTLSSGRYTVRVSSLGFTQSEQIVVQK